MKEDVFSAQGVRGTIIVSSDGELFFRVYNQDKTFIDYYIKMHDIEVTISDSDACLYKRAEVLDYSPDTLGY